MNTLGPHAPRLLAGFGTAALLTGIVLFASSRPARTAGGPVPVTVANAPLPTTDADAPAKHGVQFQANVVIPDGQQGVDKTLYTVPTGKRLVIETVSAESNIFGDTDHYTIEYDSSGGLTGSNATGAFDLLPNGSPFSAGESHPHQYADAGNVVIVTLDRTESKGVSNVAITVMGYLVDVSGPGGS